MENALLIGLSRQVTLERQLDVVANNVANVNTNGFKADKSLFQEYLMPGAHEDNFVGSDRRESYVEDRGTYRDFSQGAAQQTKNPLDVAIQGNGFLVVQTAAGERYTRDGGLQLNNQGQLVTEEGDQVLGTAGPITFQPTDHDVNIAPDGTVTVQEGTNRTDALRGKQLWLSHGTHDNVIPLANAQAIAHHMAPLPVAVSYHEFPSAHEIRPSELAATVAWLESLSTTPTAF